MNDPRFYAIVLILFCGLACKRHESSAAPTHATQPASSPATTRAAPSRSFLTIGTVTYEFPPAHLRVARKDETLFVQLYSLDPSAASLDDNGGANGYYFDMTCDAPGNAPLSAAPMLLTGPTDQRPESPNGITGTGRERT